jgi:uncharacterized repeat protein (TIGR03803 family)
MGREDREGIASQWSVVNEASRDERFTRKVETNIPLHGVSIFGKSSPMRNITLLLAAVALQLSAQQPARIWGMTTSGGANNKGTVFVVDADGTDFTTVVSFDEASGWNAEGGLCLAPNGLLYGLTNLGGTASPAAGTLFTIDPATYTFTKLRDFNITNGGFNFGTLVVGADGLLYGAGYAGTNGGGSIYRIDPATNAYTELYALDQSIDGAGINSRLLQTADGLFYGAASQGGVNGQAGTLFRYDAVNDVFTKLHDFDGALGGRTPYGGLTQASNGWLYGTTFEGGVQNHGIVYKLDPVNDVFVKVKDIDDMNGTDCWNTLVNAGGDLVGTVTNGGLNGGGFIFTIDPSSDLFTVVNDFAVATGNGPFGSLESGPDGQLYGMAQLGGTAFFGTLYRFDPLTLQRTTLYNFDNAANGGLPRGEVLVTGTGVGISERPDAASISLMPNPSGGQVVLECTRAMLPMQVSIIDALGRTLGSGTITDVRTVMELGGTPGMRVVMLTGRAGIRTLHVLIE